MIAPVAHSGSVNSPKKLKEEQAPVCCACWHKSADSIGYVFSTTEGINKAAKFGASIINFISKVFGALADGWYSLSTAFKAVATFLDVTDIVARAVEFAKGEIKGAWKIASRVFLTAFRILCVIDFLEKVKLINLKGVMETLGNVPVLGWIINLPSSLLGLASFSFSLVHNSLQLKADKAKAKLNDNKRIALEARQKALTEKDSAKKAVLESTYTKAVEEVRAAKVALGKLKPADVAAKKVEDIAVQFNNRVDTKKGEKTLAVRIENCDIETRNTRISKIKNIVAIINDVIKVTCIALSLLGLLLGGILVASSIPMMALGVVASAMGLYKCFHDKIAKDSVEKLKPVKA